MTKALLLATAAFAATRMALAAVGVYPAIPYSLVIAIALGALPFAVCAAWAGTKQIHPALAMLCGVGVVAVYSINLFWCAAAAVALIMNRHRVSRRLFVSVLGASAAVLLFYACVFNCNYLAALVAHGRLHDEQLALCDRAIYARLFGKADQSYVGLFPLVGGSMFHFFENAYGLLFGEIVLVALLMRAEVGRFLRILGMAYGSGIFCFLLFPTVGPPIYFPDSFAGFAGSLTAEMSKSEHAEFQALTAGGKLNGFGYFVAAPSLHVLAAIVLQGLLCRNATLFWAFLPINIAVIASTFLLGQHYLVDVAAGGIMGAILWRFTLTAKQVCCRTVFSSTRISSGLSSAQGSEPSPPASETAITMFDATEPTNGGLNDRVRNAEEIQDASVRPRIHQILHAFTPYRRDLPGD